MGVEPSPAPLSPYVGLAPYTDADAMLFFGRDDEAATVAANLMAWPLTVLYGASGVGKTSLLRAGVSPRRLEELSAGAEGDEEGPVLVICSSWHNDPVDALARAIREAVPELALPPRDDGLEATLRAVAESGRELFLVLDQFEEYFVYNSQNVDRSLADALRSAIAEPSVRVNFLISLREDALAKFDSRLSAIPRLLDHRLQVEPLDRRAALAAVIGPLEVFNRYVPPDAQVEIEPALADRVVDEVSAATLSLDAAPAAFDSWVEAPYLQLVMRRLWEAERAAGSRVLRLTTLEALGGAEQIVRTQLDQSLHGLSSRERQVAVALFRFLVTPSGTKIALTAVDLAAYTGRKSAEVRSVLDELVRGRILRSVVPTPGSSEPRFELYHDVLAPAIVDWSARHSRVKSRRRRAALVGLSATFMIVLVIVALVVTTRASG